uniref:AP2/ERF domain-containing protein n=1 Tax=Euplotes crassus TaxID=5936 RepID=A0A7S3K8S1_EUPCR|mmetsp:Transcript_11927/g.11931  ORF Transcript_11927/g.11931 Transcript_11927/m.11931 type:complete len:174 (+) Transcript_11927:101-622(+)|eukprot:CAMPEP_0197001060 /NCGR_PEP_ID=MMETSP1380-20130617/5846_1 /TAXON_ID=5936 /ORGANISM="Euplotes crassus, Strain CT5" /LENGTH=173 /DNA_ID=CAMNT_0042418581 /DNA_START=217 /DNA_END=738 /DNA_ORIENTATION=+
MMLQTSLDALSKHFCVCPQQIPTNDIDAVQECLTNEGSPNNKAAFRRTRISSMHFDDKVGALRQALSVFHNPDEVVFMSNTKGKDRINASVKRSKYIGVCKNGPHWQALISINKKKTYIGTYQTQVLAAKAYDLYCMLLQGLKGKTNFCYTKAEVEEMIDNYVDQGRNENIQF